MSLDAFGGVVSEVPHICKNEIDKLCSTRKMGVSFDSLDDGDVEVIDDAMRSFGPVSFYYSIHSSPEDSDATQLWLDASDLAAQLLRENGIDPLGITPSNIEHIHFPAGYFRRIVESRLGGFISGLNSVSKNGVPAVTLVDGGIEDIKIAPPDICIEEILRLLVLPWDLSPNILYVYDRSSS